MPSPVPQSEVVELLRQAIRGERLVSLPRLRPPLGFEVSPGMRWHDVIIGEFTCVIGGYTVVCFLRGDEIKYLASVSAPDGRSATYTDWRADGGREVLDDLTGDEVRAIQRLLQEVSPTEGG